ncbi:predicted protein [Naegleria gruberi]|uniref:Predicted protein n=1 Tax=Naegleria gruberi TaxID=5762 RepID=D2UXY8_NAEGR|nr:uncharacterized protein NAEGRDRAFT_61285 [Naegleria gruberi]EFC50376.1 predicted protein [Naegleria gruberi]|eukprot:XP_002683120.1 predicted protein [Naegleria gruberi strain NEG-M]
MYNNIQPFFPTSTLVMINTATINHQECAKYDVLFNLQNTYFATYKEESMEELLKEGFQRISKDGFNVIGNSNVSNSQLLLPLVGLSDSLINVNTEKLETMEVCNCQSPINNKVETPPLIASAGSSSPKKKKKKTPPSGFSDFKLENPVERKRKKPSATIVVPSSGEGSSDQVDGIVEIDISKYHPRRKQRNYDHMLAQYKLTKK